MKTIRYAVLTLLAGGLAMAQATEPIPPAADTPPVPAEAPVPAAEPSPPVAADCPPEGVPPPPEALPLPVDPGYTTQPQYKAPKHVKSRIGLAAMIGGGATQFFSDAGRDRLDVGASWSARLELGTRSYIGGEFAYLGSIQELRGFEAVSGTGPMLMSNGTEGLIRWNILTGVVQPYAGVGIGWKSYRLRNTDVPVADLQGAADFAHVPAVAGISLRAGGFVLDGRFGVTTPVSQTLISGSNLVSWDASGRLGFEF
jgi:hypothetical protein